MESKLLQHIIQNVHFSTKIYDIKTKQKKKTVNKLYTQKIDNRNCLEWAQILGLTDENFKSVINRMYRELRKAMFKRFKGNMKAMNQQIQKYQKEIEIIKIIKFKFGN